jgi:tetratricopeptide (TPR) repeat protein
MKQIILVTMVSIITVSCFAQGNKNIPAVSNNPHLKVFKQSAVSGDLATGITALSYYVAEPGANATYEDTLAMLYLQQNSYPQCFYWANKRLKLKPEDLTLMEMKGICLNKLNQPKEAIAIYETLYAKTKSPYHAYSLMELQYGIKRLAECLATAGSTEKLEFKPGFTMSYNAGEEMGRTYLQAGIYNITGLALYDLDKKEDSKRYFEKALALDSNFVLARQNLDAIKSIELGANKVNAGGNGNPASPANKQK